MEIHTWGSRKERLERPDRLIFDLDPDPSLPWRRLKEAAETLRSLLSDLGLTAFVKTTGGKGLHIVVPIAPKQDWEFAKDFSKSVAERMVQSAPDQYIATMSKARRAGKIFIDYLRNARTASAVCAYSPRARSGAPVSMPVDWRELREDVRTNFTVRNVPEYLAHRVQDPWADYEGTRVSLNKATLRRL